MKDEEKNLIENLFYRLKNTELNTSERDISADNLIRDYVAKQPASPYYMTQTILIQETAIKKMSAKIEELEKRIKILNSEISNKKPSFLSGFFKKNINPQSQPTYNDNNIWRNNENILPSNYSNTSIPSTNQSLPVVNNTTSNNRSNGFLSSALQTATGVAGGMILGNMLMNIFNHSKPEEEIFDAVHNSDSNHNMAGHCFDNHVNNNLVDCYQPNDIESNQHTFNVEELNNDFDNNVNDLSSHDVNDFGSHDVNDFGSNDDNFI